jgi:hypothetical protein
VGDLGRLLGELGAGVLELPLALAGAAHGVQRALGQRGALHHGFLDLPGRAVHDAGAGDGDRYGVGLAAQLLDAALDLASVALGLAQVLTKALLVVRLGGHPDVRLEGRFQLLLLAECLIEVLDELCLTGSQFGHLGPPLLKSVVRGMTPKANPELLSASAIDPKRVFTRLNFPA